MSDGLALPRRRFLALAGGVGLGLVAGCAKDPAGAALRGPTATPTPSAAALLRSGSATGTMASAPVQLDLGGTVVTTWGYNGVVPGPEIRVRQGETVRVRLANALPEETTIHWHGISLPNAMDGVPGVTQDPVLRDGVFDYEFTAADAGSHMYHAHVGHQLDLGMYGPLIVESAEATLAYDREYTVMIDDWRDGLGATVTEPGSHGGHGGPVFGGFGAKADDDTAETESEESSGTDPDDELAPVPSGANPGPRLGGRVYPMYLINGRPVTDAAGFEVRRGERVRLRLMNIAADTGFLVALAGHQLTLTHTDGMECEPVTVDAVRLGMGERYDVIVEANNPGVWQLAAVPEAKRGLARAVFRYSDAFATSPPDVDQRPRELTGRVLDYADLRYTGPRTRPTGTPDRVHDLTLQSTSRINGQRFVHPKPGQPLSGTQADPLLVSAGELVRVVVRSDAALAHPMHLHGHPFWVGNEIGAGPLKDTVLVPAGGRLSFDFVADNAGSWMFHCHNHYHMENGMARLFNYI